jgi:aminopeptidase N
MLTRILIFAFLSMTVSAFAQTMPPIEAGVSQTLARWRAASYSDVRYKLNLTLEKMSPVLKGTIEIRAKIGETGRNPSVSAGAKISPASSDTLPNGRVSASDIILDWRKIRGKEDLSTVSNVSVNGKPAKYEETNEHLVFKDGVIKGENVIKLDFTSPIATSGAAITRYVDKEDGAEYVYSLFVPSDASTAFPVFDQPDLKARFKLQIQSNSFTEAVSNTSAIRGIVNGKYKFFNFRETNSISTYVFAFAVGNFYQFSEADYSKELTLLSSTNGKFTPCPMEALDKGDDCINFKDTGSNIYVRKSQAEKFKQHAAEVFRLNREGVKFLESWFDYKFPFPKYDLVLIPEFPFGGMEHAGCTFLREDRVIFPTEPTKNDYITRANVIFHEAAHQWFGDTVTMRWFDDLWLKEGFAEFMAYKTLAKVMPEYNAWKIFYERNKQLAYLTDSTRGTTPIYQEIPNLSAAKSAYGNIVYRKAPSFLRQAEFYLGEDKFQTAVRAFLKKHEFANAEWTDLVKEFETASKQDLKDWANEWVKQSGVPIVKSFTTKFDEYCWGQESNLNEGKFWKMKVKVGLKLTDNSFKTEVGEFTPLGKITLNCINTDTKFSKKAIFAFPNYQDYGYGIFLLDEKSRAYVLENIQNEKDDFLRTMMWGSLWDSVREAELAPADYIRLVIKNINVETDESTIQTLLARVSTAMNYYIPEGENPRVSKGVSSNAENPKSKNTLTNVRASASERDELAAQLENLLIEKMRNAPTLGQRITFYRAFLNVASSEKARAILKELLKSGSPRVSKGGHEQEKSEVESEKPSALADAQTSVAGDAPFLLKTKDRFDIVTRLAVLNDADAPQLLADLQKTETSDEAKRYAYTAQAGFPSMENAARYFNDFISNKEISESYIESAFAPFNSIRRSELTLPYLEKALAELPNLKRNRKIFFVNGWLAAFIGGQKSEQALQIVDKFLEGNPNLDKDLRLKVLEVSDGLERAVKIRKKFSNSN